MIIITTKNMATVLRETDVIERCLSVYHGGEQDGGEQDGGEQLLLCDLSRWECQHPYTAISLLMPHVKKNVVRDQEPFERLFQKWIVSKCADNMYQLHDIASLFIREKQWSLLQWLVQLPKPVDTVGFGLLPFAVSFCDDDIHIMSMLVDAYTFHYGMVERLCFSCWHDEQINVLLHAICECIVECCRMNYWSVLTYFLAQLSFKKCSTVMINKCVTTAFQLCAQLGHESCLKALIPHCFILLNTFDNVPVSTIAFLLQYDRVDCEAYYTFLVQQRQFDQVFSKASDFTRNLIKARNSAFTRAIMDAGHKDHLRRFRQLFPNMRVFIGFDENCCENCCE